MDSSVFLYNKVINCCKGVESKLIGGGGGRLIRNVWYIHVCIELVQADTFLSW